MNFHGVKVWRGVRIYRTKKPPQHAAEAQKLQNKTNYGKKILIRDRESKCNDIKLFATIFIFAFLHSRLILSRLPGK